MDADIATAARRNPSCHNRCKSITVKVGTDKGKVLLGATVRDKEQVEDAAKCMDGNIT